MSKSNNRKRPRTESPKAHSAQDTFVLTKISDLPTSYQKLALACVEQTGFSYAPYSNFKVGAALLHPDATITTGTNWENCTYQGTCAERCAIVTANAQGKRKALAVAVYGASADKKVPNPPDDAVVTPCGLCRQMLNEVAELSNCDLDIVMVTFDKKHVRIVKLSSLLPLSFGPSNVGIDVKKWAGNDCATTRKKSK